MGDETYDDLVARLTLEDKVELLTGASAFTLRGNAAIGLAPMAFSDGPTGVRGLQFTAGEAVALLPNATLLAGTWSQDVAREVGELLAAEAARQQIHVVLGPTINLHRSPLGGRLFEQYSEDPLLTGRFAASYVRGLQSCGVGACLKHLVANESETDRLYVDSQVPESVLRELYLLPFEIAVAESGPWSVMAAYNSVNGVASTENDEVNNGILKGEWGWDGLLMSDWFATKTSAPAALGGLDLVMPGPRGPWGDALVADVRDGRVAEAVVDDHVRRLLRLADRVGALGEGRPPTFATPAPDAPERRAQLRRLATDGMVVLENDGALPLAENTPVVLVGRHAIETVCMGGGSAGVNPPHLVSLAEGLQEALGDRLTVVDGVEVRQGSIPARAEDLAHPETGAPGVRVRYHDADDVVLGEETLPVARASVGWDDDFERPVARVVMAGRLAAGGPARVGVIGSGDWTLSVDGATLLQERLALVTHDPGETMLTPPSRQVDVEAEPGALVEADLRIAPTDPRPGPDGVLGTVALMAASGAGVKGMIAAPAPRPAGQLIDEAVEAARDAELAVVAVGLTDEQETEGLDKSTLALPGEQDRLVAAVAAVARTTVVVVNAATPVLMPWAGEVDAILVVGLPGQEAGGAIADALTGVREPAGRLVTSYPADDGAAPAWEVVPTDLALAYDEGAFIGYRGYRAGLAPAPAYWFGHGLGYGTWEYDEARLAERPGVPGVRVTVRNTGPRDSREVVQVYLEPREPGEPVRLVGWAGVDVPAGDTATVTVEPDPRTWRRWSAATGAWQTFTSGDLLVARGLADVRARLPWDGSPAAGDPRLGT